MAPPPVTQEIWVRQEVRPKKSKAYIYNSIPTRRATVDKARKQLLHPFHISHFKENPSRGEPILPVYQA